jgi:hypothetical protein
MTDPHVGRIDEDSVFVGSATDEPAYAFVLSHFWNDSGGAPVANDVFRFDADPSADLVEVPVLFWQEPTTMNPTGIGFKLNSFTTNHINSVIGHDKVITPTENAITSPVRLLA